MSTLRHVVVTFAVLASCQHFVAAQESFPNVRPVLTAPKGCTLTFKDGAEDFYLWSLTEDKKQGDHARSGMSIYFGMHPGLQVEKKTAKQVKGKVCSKDVMWWVTQSGDDKNPVFRRDVIVPYDQGKGFASLQLHFMIWAPTAEEAAQLAERLEVLTFAPREKK